MNRSSIFFTITLSFVISLILIAISYVLLSNESSKRYEFSLERRYFPVVREVRRNKIDNSLKESLKLLKFKLIQKRADIDEITHGKNTHYILKKIPNNHHNEKIHRPKPFFTMLENGDKNYILFRKRGKELLLEDLRNNNKSFLVYINLAFGVVFLVLIASYTLTIRKLYPLKTLQENVKSLGEENFATFELKSNKKDEVSLLYNEFVKSALKLKNIKEARNIFIRNILHELKTPITKGRFLVELGGDKEKMQDIFSRLDALINEFALVESLSSKTTDLKKDKIFLTDIIENVQDLLLVEDEFIDKKFENISLNVNYKYFCIAVKNLVDNAIKYSEIKKAVIKNNGEDIIIENEANPLPQPIEAYKEPFGGIEEGGKKDSFGLGLYITHNILEANGYKLKYFHENGINRFICKKI